MYIQFHVNLRLKDLNLQDWHDEVYDDPQCNNLKFNINFVFEKYVFVIIYLLLSFDNERNRSVKQN